LAFYIAQAISLITTVVGIAAMQFRQMRHILIGQLLANLLAAATYFLLDGFSGAGVCLLAIVQTLAMYAFNRQQKQPPRWLIGGFIAMYIACSALSYRSPADLFSAAAAVCFALSVSQEKAAASRRWYVLNPLCWMIYDVATRAYGNLIMHLIILISTLAAMLRMDRASGSDSPT